MGRTILLGFQGKAWLALAVGCLILPVGRAQETDARKEVLKLNDVNGKDTIEAYVEALRARPEESKKLLAAAVPIAKEKNQPLNYNAALILGQLAQTAKDLPACELFYRISMNQAEKLESPKMLLESYGALVDAYYENKKYAEAGRVCQEMVNFKTDDDKKRDIILHIRNGDPEFLEVATFDPAKEHKEPFHRFYIETLTRGGKFDQALKEVDTLLKNNNSWFELEMKARIYYLAGRYDEAAKSYESVVAKLAKDTDVKAEKREELLERYRYTLSSVYIDMNKIDKASELLQKLMEAKPETASYYNDLGYVWADANVKLEEAEKLIRKAIELDRKARKANANLAPEDDHDKGAYLDSLGWVLFRQKRHKEAKEALLKAIEDKDAQHLEIYDHLGDVCMALGERAAAEEYWRKGLKFVSDTRRDKERKVSVEKKLESLK